MTGLYAQQSWMCYLIDDGQPSLNHEFPTYGKVLRDELGYNTSYFGKWHISNLDDCSVENPNYKVLEKYGFNYFWPGHEDHGSAKEGTEKDGYIADRFAAFIDDQNEMGEPFLSVVSFVNPHDVMYYPKDVIHEPKSPYYKLGVPENFESMAKLKEEKPKCQSEFRAYYNQLMGHMPDTILTDQDAKDYRFYSSHYLWLQKQVDRHIGKVIAALDRNPEVRDNTIIIFTSDHGDFIGSHGMRAKDCAVYDEVLKVPFYVVDYTGKLIHHKERGKTRSQFGCSIDIFPTMLAMAASGEDKRRIKQKYHYLPGTDLTQNISDHTQPTKDRVLFTINSGEALSTDSSLSSSIAINAPTHILCLIDEEYKAAVYDYWQMDIDPVPENLAPNRAVTIVKGNTELELYRRVVDKLPEEKWEIENLANDDKYKHRMEEYKLQLYKLDKSEFRGKLPIIGGVNLQTVSEKAKDEYVKSLVDAQSKDTPQK